MNKNYSKIIFTPGDTIEDAVKQLLEYKRKEHLACGKFNGVTLYSDTVTMDEAHKEIIGMTKAEFDEYTEKLRR